MGKAQEDEAEEVEAHRRAFAGTPSIKWLEHESESVLQSCHCPQDHPKLGKKGDVVKARVLASALQGSDAVMIP